MPDITPKLVRRLLDERPASAREFVAAATDIALAYLQVCKERDQLAVKAWDEGYESCNRFAAAYRRNEPCRHFAVNPYRGSSSDA